MFFKNKERQNESKAKQIQMQLHLSLSFHRTFHISVIALDLRYFFHESVEIIYEEFCFETEIIVVWGCWKESCI